MRRRIMKGQASRLGRMIRKMLLPALLPARCVCVYSLVGSGERRKPRRTGHFGVRVRTRSVYLNCYGRARPNYRMMK